MSRNSTPSKPGPCPICGERADVHHRHLTDSIAEAWVKCSNEVECGIRLQDDSMTPEDLIDKWNTLRMI